MWVKILWKIVKFVLSFEDYNKVDDSFIVE